MSTRPATGTVIRPERTRRGFLRRGAVALVVSVLGVALVRALVGVLVSVPAGFTALTWPPLVAVTAVSAIGATVVYAVLSRLGGDAERRFLGVAGAVLVLSYLPLVTVAGTLPGATGTLLVVLGVLHVVAAVGIVVPLLVGTAPPR
jgi:hypothetical protein